MGIAQCWGGVARQGEIGRIFFFVLAIGQQGAGVQVPRHWGSRSSAHETPAQTWQSIDPNRNDQAFGVMQSNRKASTALRACIVENAHCAAVTAKSHYCS